MLYISAKITPVVKIISAPNFHCKMPRSKLRGILSHNVFARYHPRNRAPGFPRAAIKEAVRRRSIPPSGNKLTGGIRKYLKITSCANLMNSNHKEERNSPMKTTAHLFSMIAAIVLITACLSCTKSDDEITKDTYGIILKGYTAMRIDPMIFSGIVSELNKGTSVQILERSRGKSWVGKSNGYWYKIKTKEGLTGWVFAQNISIYSSKSKDSMNRIINQFMDSERAQAKQYLIGKWWSTNEFGDFTDHCIELYDSGKYKSYLKGNEDRPIVGTYKLDFNKNEIIFSGGTSFKSNLDLAKRGNDYIIKKSMKDFELRFTKISIETSPEPELKDPGRKKPAGGGDENKAQ